MKQLKVPFCAEIGTNSTLADISDLLDKQERTRVGTELWASTEFIPRVKFVIAHNGDSIFIKYYVTEKYAQAIYRQTNEPVSKDSCVEFFIALDDEGSYYNLEFNCIGTGLMGYGTKDREERHYLPIALIEKVRRQVHIKGEEHTVRNLIDWEIAIAIPLEVFSYHNLSSFEGLKCSANFHKCGDNLPEPHYIVWNEIKAEQPNFHLPEYFGEIEFLQRDVSKASFAPTISKEIEI